MHVYVTAIQQIHVYVTAIYDEELYITSSSHQSLSSEEASYIHMYIHVGPLAFKCTSATVLLCLSWGTGYL